MTEKHPFAHLPPTPTEHFKLYYYAAVLQIIEQVVNAFDSPSDAFTHFPFLVGYHNELVDNGLQGRAFGEAAVWWHKAMLNWEDATNVHLPLRALREMPGLNHSTMIMLMCIGLVEDDPRFGQLYETVQGIPGQHRPTIGLLTNWMKTSSNVEALSQVRQLQDLALIHPINPEAPRAEWALQVPAPIWDALRGDQRALPATGLNFLSPDCLTAREALIIPEELCLTINRIPMLFESGEVQAIVVRGPQHNGRRTLLGSIALSFNQGLIIMDGKRPPHDNCWRFFGLLSVLLHAMPVIALELAPGETVEIPRPCGFLGPIGVVLGKQGGLTGPGVERALTITLDMPDMPTRKKHWLRALGERSTQDLHSISQRFRLTSGNIYRTAQLAQSYAALDGRTAITVGDVQEGSRALSRQSLDTLAMRLKTSGDWSDLAVSQEALRELHNLENRCHHRERLCDSISTSFRTQMNCGVRALFTGPSGTGKTLAARLLASILQMDLYRLDLSAVINKYIGETEKNLNQVLARAEELNVILLLDEGDALLTQRTSVQTSNDRYANLETNFLLQRLESFEGILIITTNSVDHIDSAFQRRMDVIIEFRPPDMAERWNIWSLHLPSTHQIDSLVLQEIASRCVLTGGQIRNAALHASLLALDDGGDMTTAFIEEAVRREYLKIGAVCPLRQRG